LFLMSVSRAVRTIFPDHQRRPPQQISSKEL
jgi:hypothetical protein